MCAITVALGCSCCLAQKKVKLVQAASLQSTEQFRNFLSLPGGDYFIVADSVLYHFVPGGKPLIYSRVPGHMAGIALLPDGNLLIAGQNKMGTPSLWRVTSFGLVNVLAVAPQAKTFTQLRRLNETSYLIADPIAGAIWLYNATNKRLRPLLTDSLLANPTKNVPTSLAVRTFRDTVYAANAARSLVLKIPVVGIKAGKPIVWMEGYAIRDFAFDKVAGLYGLVTTGEILHRWVGGTVEVLATGSDALIGATAMGFGRGKGDQSSLVLLIPGQLVKIEVGHRGDD